MTSPMPEPNPIILHLPPGSAEWASILAQFSLHVITREGRAYAAWAGDRLVRFTKSCDGVVAMADGQLLAIMLFEHLDDAVEFSLPWTRRPHPRLVQDLAAAALQVARERFPQARYLRAERQLLPADIDLAGLAAAGFACYRRHRMALDLITVRDEGRVPAGFHLVPWHIRYLDAVAEVVYRANAGTLDALLYAPFFGDSPAQCRRGLLAILAGRYGPVLPQATLCAFKDTRLVGINLLIEDNPDQASIVEISVDPDCQGLGLGRALMTRSLRLLRQRKMLRAELAVTAANTRALRLYESLGFYQVSDFHVCIWPGEAADLPPLESV